MKSKNITSSMPYPSQQPPSPRRKETTPGKIAWQLSLLGLALCTLLWGIAVYVMSQ